LSNQSNLFGDDTSGVSNVNTAPPSAGLERVSVLVPVPLPGPLDYLAEAPLAIGTLVQVKVHGRSLIGVVWPSAADNKKHVPISRLRPITGVIPGVKFTHEQVKFIEWVAHYTLAAPGMVMKMALSSPDIGGKPPTRNHVIIAGELPQRMSVGRQSVLDVLKGSTNMSVAETAEAAGVSDSVVRGLVKAGTLQLVEVSVDAPWPQPDPEADGPILSDEQTFAAKAIGDAVRAEEACPFLLDGVTGSGKTEVYFEGLIEALKSPGAQVLVLVPEIALTSQWLERFTERFGAEPVIWHSAQGQASRRRAWHAVAKGEARVVVGARSALFLPFQKLGLIVVDEEHDPGFKQEDGVCYHARDMAVVRGVTANCPVVLASATPSMESVVNTQRGKYQLLELRERHGNAVLPDMHAIDMRVHPPASGQWISPILASQIDAALGRAEQTILFLNRRGYAPLTLCRACGHRIECPNCTAWLVEHRFNRSLQCHHCGYHAPTPDACPSCEEPDAMVACGPGVERLAEEAIKRFPDARIQMMTSDTVDNPKHMADLIGQIEAGLVDIIIGTQIVTKGYHFPDLTVVGVVDADLGLRGGDLRAGERTWQQLVQVSGRAGRAEKPGKVYLQSYEPEHPVVHALLSGDGATFMEQERSVREHHGMPPYGKLVALVLTGPDMRAMTAAGRALAASAPTDQGLLVLGPAPAPMSRVKGDYRYRMLLQAPHAANVQAIVRAWISRAGQLKGIRLKIDVDPYSFM